MDGALYRGWAELGHVVVVADGPPCQGTCTGRGHLEAVASGSAADRAAEKLWGEGATAELLVRPRGGGRSGGARGARRDRPSARRRRSARSSTSSRRSSTIVGGGFGIAAADFLFPSALEVAAARGARRRARGHPDRQGGARLRRGADRRRVCSRSRRSLRSASAARGLRDADRQPRGRDAARARASCAEADVVLCEDTRHTRACSTGTGSRRSSLSYHQHNEAQRTAELLPRLAAGERIALVSDAGLPGVNDPGARLIAAALEAGVPVTVLPGPVGRRDRARRERARRRAVPVPRLPAARREGARRALGRAREPGRIPPSRSSLRSGCRRRCARSRRRCPTAGRGLPRADEAVRGGRARAPPRSVAARFPEPPKGEIDARRRRGRAGGRPGRCEPRALAAVVELVAAGVPRRQAADVVARLARVSRNTLYAESLKSR